MGRIKLSYIMRRAASAIFTLWVALTINFLLPRIMGGNPADYIASQVAMGSQEHNSAWIRVYLSNTRSTW